MMKRITLCADDYGMHPAVSDVIIDLAQQQKLHATSCLVTADHWSSDSIKLLHIRPFADIGLHLNFTEGKGLSQPFRTGLPGLNKMLLFSHARLLNQRHLVQEIRCQLQTFIDTTGFVPDFIDGHQHVHHLPQVRDALWQALKKLPLPEHFWIRSIAPLLGQTGGIKNQIILHSGAIPFNRQLQRKGLTTNKAFAGVYSLANDEPFSEYINNWLTLLPSEGLIMCHPAKNSGKAKIDHIAARTKEYDYLSSPDFSHDCDRLNVTLARLRLTSSDRN